jgi:hypothetical protein
LAPSYAAVYVSHEVSPTRVLKADFPARYSAPRALARAPPGLPDAASSAAPAILQNPAAARRREAAAAGIG